MEIPHGTGNGHSVLEVTSDKEIIWKLDQYDLPGITLAWVTQVRRLQNGNTLFVNCHAGPKNPQIIEMTPDKEVVWTYRDFELFGNALPVAVVEQRFVHSINKSIIHSPFFRRQSSKE